MCENGACTCCTWLWKPEVNLGSSSLPTLLSQGGGSSTHVPWFECDISLPPPRGLWDQSQALGFGSKGFDMWMHLTLPSTLFWSQGLPLNLELTYWLTLLPSKLQESVCPLPTPTPQH